MSYRHGVTVPILRSILLLSLNDSKHGLLRTQSPVHIDAQICDDTNSSIVRIYRITHNVCTNF